MRVARVPRRRRGLLLDAELRRMCIDGPTGQVLDLAVRAVRPPPDPAGVRTVLLDLLGPQLTLTDLAWRSEPEHDPSEALRAFTVLRDRSCDGPTKPRRRAARCDLDYARPHPAGPTAAWNLACRSRRTHQLEHYGWTPVRTATGTLWTSPAGHLVDVPHSRRPAPASTPTTPADPPSCPTPTSSPQSTPPSSPHPTLTSNHPGSHPPNAHPTPTGQPRRQRRRPTVVSRVAGHPPQGGPRRTSRGGHRRASSRTTRDATAPTVAMSLPHLLEARVVTAALPQHPTSFLPTDGGRPIRQLSRRGVLGVWAAAALPMGALAWIGAPAMADGGGAALARALLVCLTLGLAWQLVLVVVLVAREQGTLRWGAVRRALWLQAPTSPRSGRVGGRTWLALIPLVVAFAAVQVLPAPPAVGGRDLGAFLETNAGKDMFAGSWGWFALVVAMVVLNTVLGEELLFRGWLLPRMSGAFGKRDWLVNGVLFAGYHLHVPWAIPLTLLDTLILAYPSRRYRSALIGISVHSAQGVVLTLLLLSLVLR